MSLPNLEKALKPEQKQKARALILDNCIPHAKGLQFPSALFIDVCDWTRKETGDTVAVN